MNLHLVDKFFQKFIGIFAVFQVYSRLVKAVFEWSFLLHLKSLAEHTYMIQVHHFEGVCFIFILDALLGAFKHFFSLMDKHDVIAKLFDGLHSMRRKYHRGTFFSHVNDFVSYQRSIDGIKTRERFVENEKFWLVQYRSDKLHFLLHTF